MTPDLGMKWISAKFVSRVVIPEQKEHRLTVSQEPIDRAGNDENFLPSIIAGDETWVYGYDPETKHQSSQ